MTKLKKVEITWLDAQCLDLTPSLIRPEDVKGLNGVVCSIIGYLIDENEDRFVVAKEKWMTGQYKYIHIIPKNPILKVKTLK